jgi:hypothetical protein
MTADQEERLVDALELIAHLMLEKHKSEKENANA